MATRRCPKCRSEYLATVEVCVDCDVELEDVETMLADAGSESSPYSGSSGIGDGDVLDGRVTVDRSTGRVSFALDDWASETRMMIGQLLAGEGIPFLWEAGTLVVTTESRVQAEELIAQADAVSRAVFDTDVETATYELDDWSDVQVNRLSEALVSQRIPFEFDMEGNLVIADTDEERVEGIFDGLDLDWGDDAEADSDSEDIDIQAVLSDLFVAVDRLRRSATDHEGVLGLLAAAGPIEGTAIPFGFDPSVWAEIVGQTRRLRSALEEDSMTDEQIEMAAGEMRAFLHEFV